MRMRKCNFADALYVGPDVEPEEVLDIFWPERPRDDVAESRFGFNVFPTRSGNQLFIPVMRFEVRNVAGVHEIGTVPKEGRLSVAEVNPKIYVADKPCQWPILPVHEYRGGYMTATARAAVELAHQPYFTPDYEYIERPLTEVYHQRGIYVGGVQVDTRGWTEMVRGKYIRTRHRVLYVDRVKGFIIVDSLLRPGAEDAS